MHHDVALAIDIGGKSIKCGLVIQSGGLLQEIDKIPLPFTPDPDKFFSTLQAAIENALAVATSLNTSVRAVGIGVPGRVDGTAGVAYESTNLRWPQTNFRKLIENWTGLPTFVEHDVRCGAIAESAFGALVGHSDFLYVAIGTGIGAGISIRGSLYSGPRSFGGEIGHAVVYPHGRQCLCGKRGCLEAYCAAKQIEMRYQEVVGEYISCAEIVNRAQHGCQVCGPIWDEALEALAFALVNYSMVLDPTKIVIGGGVSEAGEDALIAPLLKKMARISNSEQLPEVSLSLMNRNSGLIGAGYQVFLRS